MSLPNVAPSAIHDALLTFDREHRDTPPWQGWERRESHKYAIASGGRLYPVKFIVSLATGVSVSEFSGGAEANSFVTSRGFTVAPLGTAMISGTAVGFAGEDFALFARHPTRRPWREIPVEDQEAYKELRQRLKVLSEAVAFAYPSTTQMRAFQSHPTPNGRNATDLWCCIFPAQAENKSFALQYALIMSPAGLEICFCLGAGTAQTNPETLSVLRTELLRVRAELVKLDSSVLDSVAQNLSKTQWKYRRSWRQPAGTSDFTNLSDWVKYAASPQGDGASISLNLSREEAEALGTSTVASFLEWGAAFVPIFDSVYAHHRHDLPRPLRLPEASLTGPILPAREQRVWLIAPGERARLWPEFVKEGIAAIGWDDIGDLRAYPDKQALADAIRTTYERDTAPVNDATACFDFSRVMQPGDLIFAKQGTRTLVGVGIIRGDYSFRPDRPEYKHVRPVEWTAIGPWQISPDMRLVIKTLTDLTEYPDYVEKLRIISKGGEEAHEVTSSTYPIDYTLEQFVADTGLSRELALSWLARIRRKQQVVFQGPPGTGKTFIAERLAWLLVSEGEGFVDLVQLHPSYTYEDFMLGLRPDVKDGAMTFSYRPGRFLSFCREAERAGADSPCVMIIDEFNRANLPRVLGELLYLLEYRDRRIPLAGSDIELAIPPNVYVIGTMNTADRSIALVDHALRRRFSFITIGPDYDLLRSHLAKHGLDPHALIAILQGINVAIGDAHYEVGVSFFMKDGAALPEALEDIWKGEIESYLEEYFYDNPAKVDGFRWSAVKERLETLRISV